MGTCCNTAPTEEPVLSSLQCSELAMKLSMSSSLSASDLKIIHEPTNECNCFSDDIPMTEQCSNTTRLCTALMFFHTIHHTATLSDEEERKHRFIEYNETIYKSIIDDTTHFIQEHEGDINRVYTEWTQQYGLLKCSVSECPQIKRHYDYGNDRRRRKKGDNELYYFYESLFDRIHFYVFHLFDVGLRVNAEGNEEEMNLNLDGVTVDTVFAAERDHIISQRKKCNLHFGRFNENNNKFLLKITDKDPTVTLMDVLFEELKLQRLEIFLKDNAFDSDAVDMDLEDMTDSNISALIQSQPLIEKIRNLIHSAKSTYTLFSRSCVFLLFASGEWSLNSIVIYTESTSVSVSTGFKFIYDAKDEWGKSQTMSQRTR